MTEVLGSRAGWENGRMNQAEDARMGIPQHELTLHL
jgi:hypothetical protein